MKKQAVLIFFVALFLLFGIMNAGAAFGNERSIVLYKGWNLVVGKAIQDNVCHDTDLGINTQYPSNIRTLFDPLELENGLLREKKLTLARDACSTYGGEIKEYHCSDFSYTSSVLSCTSFNCKEFGSVVVPCTGDNCFDASCESPKSSTEKGGTGIITYVYAWLPDTQEYAEIFPILRSTDDVTQNKFWKAQVLLNTAFWVWAEENSVLKYTPDPKLSWFPYNTRMEPRWNFVAVPQEFVGKNLGEIKGDCDINSAWWFDNSIQNWVDFWRKGKPDIPFQQGMVDMGLSIYINNPTGCRLMSVPSGTDTSPPIVKLISPPSGTADTDGTVDFEYSVSDSSFISNCSLYLDEKINITDFIVTKDIPQTFNIINIKRSDSLKWLVSCSDSLSNVASSSTYVLDTNL